MVRRGGRLDLPADAVAEVAHRPDTPADIVVAAPAGTDPELYRDAGATWRFMGIDGLGRGWKCPLMAIDVRPGITHCRRHRHGSGPAVPVKVGPLSEAGT